MSSASTRACRPRAGPRRRRAEDRAGRRADRRRCSGVAKAPLRIIASCTSRPRRFGRDRARLDQPRRDAEILEPVAAEIDQALGRHAATARLLEAQAEVGAALLERRDQSMQHGRGPASRSTGPARIRPGRSGPCTVKVPLRASTSRLASTSPPSAARARPRQFAQSPRPSTCAISARSTPARPARKPPPGRDQREGDSRAGWPTARRRAPASRSPPARPGAATVRSIERRPGRGRRRS